VLAKLAARRGDNARAETLAGEAVALSDTMQSPVHQADARSALAEVFALAGKTDRAIAELERAADLYGHKGATGYQTDAQNRLRELKAI